MDLGYDFYFCMALYIPATLPSTAATQSGHQHQQF